MANLSPSNSNITFGQIGQNDSKNDITYLMDEKTATKT